MASPEVSREGLGDLKTSSMAKHDLSGVHTFPVGWGSFDPDLKKPDGFIDFIVVDDYTAYNLHDGIHAALPQIGSKPDGWDGDLPTNDWRVLHAIHTMASNDLYAKGGITKPTFEQLPAVFCIVHGNPIGSCVFNAQIDKAIDFMKQQLELRE